LQRIQSRISTGNKPNPLIKSEKGGNGGGNIGRWLSKCVNCKKFDSFPVFCHSLCIPIKLNDKCPNKHPKTSNIHNLDCSSSLPPNKLITQSCHYHSNFSIFFFGLYFYQLSVRLKLQSLNRFYRNVLQIVLSRCH